MKVTKVANSLVLLSVLIVLLPKAHGANNVTCWYNNDNLTRASCNGTLVTYGYHLACYTYDLGHASNFSDTGGLNCAVDGTSSLQVHGVTLMLVVITCVMFIH